MLALPPLRSSSDDISGEEEMGSFPIGSTDIIDFTDLSTGNMLESIDFDDLFIGIDVDGDVLPDLEMDPEVLADFSGSGEDSDVNPSVPVEKVDHLAEEKEKSKVSGSDLNRGTGPTSVQSTGHSSPKDVSHQKRRKSSTQSKSSQGSKRKVKVDWTPELHRRFVQAVEQLGVEKAVPSRILELMGIDCLTRHNIASHLQKYRSHRKHLLAREAEAASWSQHRQMYSAAGGPGAGGGKRSSITHHWLAPTVGFPPVAPIHHFRPLHVWGHPSVNQSIMHAWPSKHLASFPAPPTWPPPSVPANSSYWHPASHRGPSGFLPQPIVAGERYGGALPPVAGIPPQHAVATMYRSPEDHNPASIGVPAHPQTPPHALLDFHPSKESIDAALSDAISKPWQPLPLGLKPPSLDSVLVELHRQGIPNIPTLTAAAITTTASSS